MAVSRSAALKVDWVKVTSSLNLRGQTVSALHAFKKRNEDARRRVQALSALPTGVDFDAYRAQLGNRAIVDEVERRLQALRPDTYDVGRQLKAIDAFEAEALRNAEETRETVRAQLKDLQKTMENIEQARPFDELTVDDMAKAEPSIDQRTEQLVVKGRWVVPGYKEKFGDLSLM